MESEKPITTVDKETNQWSEKLKYLPRAIGFVKVTSGAKKETEVLDQTNNELKTEEANKVMEKTKIPEKVKENQKELNQSNEKPEEHHQDLNKQLQNLKLELQEKEKKFKKAQQDLEGRINFLEEDRSYILSDLYESIKEAEYYKNLVTEKTAELVDTRAEYDHFYFSLGPYYEQCIDWMNRRIHEFKALLDAELSGARVHRLEATILGLEKEVVDLRDELRRASSTTSTAGSENHNHSDEYEFVE